MLRAIILILLWGFVVAAIVAVRHDVFGTRPARAPAPAKQPRSAAPKPQRADKADKKSAARKLVVTDGAIAGTTVTLTADA
ncbi:MAG TPA: hypothetical protein VFJ98_03015, partial [Mycobacteriales bacterium]|nr:hypothetical protein [Mycobacteriales bacterium]